MLLDRATHPSSCSTSAVVRNKRPIKPTASASDAGSSDGKLFFTRRSPSSFPTRKSKTMRTSCRLATPLSALAASALFSGGHQHLPGGNILSTANAMVMSREMYPDSTKQKVQDRRKERQMCGKHTCQAEKDQFRAEHNSRVAEIDAWLRRGLEGWFINETWKEQDNFDMCVQSYEDYADTMALDDELHREKYHILEALTRKASQKPVLRKFGVNQQEFLKGPIEDGFERGLFQDLATNILNGQPIYLQKDRSKANTTDHFLAMLDEVTKTKFMEQHPDGIILKPSDGTNSIGVVWIQILWNKFEIRKYFDHEARINAKKPSEEELEKLDFGYRTFAFYLNKDEFFTSRNQVLSYLLSEHIPHYHEYMQKTVWNQVTRKARWFVEEKVPVGSMPPVTWTPRQVLSVETSPLEIRVNVMCREILGFWISIEGNEFDNCLHKNGTFGINNPELWTVLANNWGGLDENPRAKFEEIITKVAELYMAFHPAEMGNIPMVRFDFFAHPERNGKFYTYNEGVYGIAAQSLRTYEKRVQAYTDEMNGHKIQTVTRILNRREMQKREKNEANMKRKSDELLEIDGVRAQGWPLGQKYQNGPLYVGRDEVEQAKQEANAAAEKGKVVLDEDARVFYIDNFASDAEMDAIMQAATPALDVSHGGSVTGRVTELEVTAHPLLRKVELRKHALLDLDNHMPGTTRVRQYSPGNGHPIHTDWWNKYVVPGKPNNLIATLHLFMTDVEEGGATDFPKLGKEVIPKRGRLAVWWSCDKNAKINPISEHEGKEIIRGTKWTATTFIYNYMDRCMPNVTMDTPVQAIYPDDFQWPAGADDHAHPEGSDSEDYDHTADEDQDDEDSAEPAASASTSRKSDDDKGPAGELLEAGPEKDVGVVVSEVAEKKDDNDMSKKKEDKIQTESKKNDADKTSAEKMKEEQQAAASKDPAAKKQSEKMNASENKKSENDKSATSKTASSEGTKVTQKKKDEKDPSLIDPEEIMKKRRAHMQGEKVEDSHEGASDSSDAVHEEKPARPMFRADGRDISEESGDDLDDMDSNEGHSSLESSDDRSIPDVSVHGDASHGTDDRTHKEQRKKDKGSSDEFMVDGVHYHKKHDYLDDPDYEGLRDLDSGEPGDGPDDPDAEYANTKLLSHGENMRVRIVPVNGQKGVELPPGSVKNTKPNVEYVDSSDEDEDSNAGNQDRKRPRDPDSDSDAEHQRGHPDDDMGGASDDMSESDDDHGRKNHHDSAADSDHDDHPEDDSNEAPSGGHEHDEGDTSGEDHEFKQKKKHAEDAGEHHSEE
ncbi:unnamed protein product [Amoebophrya sp. A120]|nr:unnamed protein product [Amoebophrya sp. A120]|eukprot:GSA120T00010924001.1